ncbi:MAG: toprim domain-containing protein [Thiolinea sp.]
MYGLFEARQQTRKLERLLVVEGYLDVIALAQFGVSYAVATLGTATTSEHIRQLFRLVPEVVFCFDGDRAGKAAAWRALENALPELEDGRDLRFLFLPSGEDPDTQIRRVGAEQFEADLKRALPLSRFFIIGLKEQLGHEAGATLHLTEDSARFSAEASRLLNQMPDSLLKNALLQEVQRLGKVPGAASGAKDNVEAETDHWGGRRWEKRFPRRGPERPQGAPSRPGDHEVKRTPVRYAITLLLYAPELAAGIPNPEKLLEWALPGMIYYSGWLK